MFKCNHSNSNFPAYMCIDICMHVHFNIYILCFICYDSNLQTHFNFVFDLTWLGFLYCLLGIASFTSLTCLIFYEILVCVFTATITKMKQIIMEKFRNFEVNAKGKWIHAKHVLYTRLMIMMMMNENWRRTKGMILRILEILWSFTSLMSMKTTQPNSLERECTTRYLTSKKLN